MKRSLLLPVFLLLAFAPAALAYNIVLKNGSILFAREKFTVKANKAIITLQNGTVVSYDLDQIDVPGTEKYNKENAGNVIALETGGDRAAPTPQSTAAPSTTLQDIIRKRKMTLGAAPPKKEQGDGTANSFQSVEPSVEQAFRRILDGASITQYRLASYRGKVRLLATANTEEAVFNTLAATARALSDLASHGKEINVDIVLTTSSGDSGGSFEMSPDQARQIVNGNINAADYFLRNVIL
ncbi:MAG TPA: hypothetical protein VK780_03765 [Thermoanaerobaculia bacterium]|jgi:hypothetical protein|nr:hypothetical protein [Thermoanaerobaculia bacterium]